MLNGWMCQKIFNLSTFLTLDPSDYGEVDHNYEAQRNVQRNKNLAPQFPALIVN